MIYHEQLVDKTVVSGDLWISVLPVFVDPAVVVLLCAVHSQMHAVLCD